MFDWEDLRYFATFARTGSLSSAAKVLGVDHATIARKIASLEKSLNVKLVDRRPRAYHLTDKGRQVAAFADDMNQSAFGLERFVEADQDGVKGEVTLSSPPAFAGTLVAPHVGRLYSKYPDLRLRLVGTKEAMSLSRREADISIGFSRPSEATLVARRLGRLEFALYASKRYLGSRRQAEFIGYDETMKGTPQQAWLEQRAGQRSLVMCSNDLRIQAAAAAGSAGVVLLPRFLAAEHNLVRFEPDGPTLALEIWLSVHKDVRHAPRMRAVMDFVAECIEPAYQM